MWVTRDLATLQLSQPAGLTIGAFDGVHQGHQALIRQLVVGAHADALNAVVLTFDPLPWQVLGDAEKSLLSDLDERLDIFAALGVDGVIVHPFTQTVAAMRAQAFIEHLVAHVALRALWIGPDFTLGRHQEGDAAFLRAAGQQLGFSVHIFREPLRWQGQPVRSTRIRAALLAGRLETANSLLGRPYRLQGEVVHGEKRGRALGFPTANLAVPVARLVPANGIYVCRARLRRGTFGAVTNIGHRPTFNHSERTVEAFLLDFSATIYGETMQLELLHRLRPELKFDSVEALVAQMEADVEQARAWLMDDPVFSPVMEHVKAPSA